MLSPRAVFARFFARSAGKLKSRKALLPRIFAGNSAFFNGAA
jgi:hypothetical protein